MCKFVLRTNGGMGRIFRKFRPVFSSLVCIFVTYDVLTPYHHENFTYGRLAFGPDFFYV